MKPSIKDFEIMAPVGSRESLAAAIQAGAESIYFGIEIVRHGLNLKNMFICLYSLYNMGFVSA